MWQREKRRVVERQQLLRTAGEFERGGSGHGARDNLLSRAEYEQQCDVRSANQGDENQPVAERPALAGWLRPGRPALAWRLPPRRRLRHNLGRPGQSERRRICSQITHGWAGVSMTRGSVAPNASWIPASRARSARRMSWS